MIVFDPKCYRTIALDCSQAKATVRPKTVGEVAADRTTEVTPANLTDRLVASVAESLVKLEHADGTVVTAPKPADLSALPYPDLMQLLEEISGLTHSERKNSDTSSPS